MLIFWVVVAGIAVGPSDMLTGAQENDAVSWLPGEAESTKVIQAAATFQSQDEIPAIVVYERTGQLTSQDIASVDAQVAKLNAIKGVDRDSVGPIPSEDKRALQVVVPINAGSGGWDTLAGTVDEIRAIAKDSPVLWLLPVISAGLALTVAQAVIYLLATKADLTVNAQSAGILTVLVFGAGTDYALLLVARYREELRRHEDRHEAMAFALHRTGPAIFASGATVIAGMLCLLVASMNSTKGLGPVAAVGIAVGLMVMLTLLPALLTIFGRWFFWPVHPTFGSVDHPQTGVWARVGKRIARAPRATWVGTSVALAIAALGVLQLNAVGLENKDAFYGTPDSVVGEQVLADHFPAGSGQPVVVIAKADRATEVKTAMQEVNGISGVADPVVKGDLAYLAGTLTDAPDSQAAIDTVDRVRDAIHQVPRAEAIAGGETATRGDVLRASTDDNKVIIPLILLVVFVVLMLLLRAVVAPVILIATVVLSFGAASGLSAMAFRHLFGFAGADASLPLFVFVFLVALGIDYNIFLMTRVHEETSSAPGGAPSSDLRPRVG